VALSDAEELEYLRMKKRRAEAIDYTVNKSGIGNVVGNTLKAVGEIPYKAGEKVSELASGMGASPEVSGGIGYGANLALQAVPMVVGGEAAKLASVPLRAVSEKLMRSALKPTIAQLRNGEAATAVDTMLSEGFNATRGGVEKIKGKIGELNDQIKEAIANSGATISKSDVGKSLMDTFERFKNQVNPQNDLEAIKKAWTEFRNHPLLAGKSDIPVQLAQDLKQGTYQQVAKKYGQLGSADIEAQKGLARGLKEGIANAVPEVGSLNAQETALIKTLNVAERRVLQNLNNNPGGLAWLTTNPASFAAFMADRSPAFKSVVARLVNAGKEQIPANVARGTIGLAEMSGQVGQRPTEIGPRTKKLAPDYSPSYEITP
jgi:hypothetical protein